MPTPRRTMGNTMSNITGRPGFSEVLVPNQLTAGLYHEHQLPLPKGAGHPHPRLAGRDKLRPGERFIPVDRERHGRDNARDMARQDCGKAAENLDSADVMTELDPAIHELNASRHSFMRRRGFRSRNTLFATALAAVPLSSFAQAVDGGNQLIARTQGYVGAELYRADITQIPSTVQSLPKRILEITCIKNCAASPVYKEAFSDNPVSVFRLWDGSNQFITIWTSGSAYWVRIYEVNLRDIRKVFDNATKTAPQFGFDSKGEPVVILDNPDSTAPAVSFEMHGAVWTWDGNRYSP
jgi:hypothetical protein